MSYQENQISDQIDAGLERQKEEYFKALLKKIGACSDARQWSKDKTWEQVFATCHRGDWLLWLFKKTNPLKIRELTLAKGHCTNLARQWMKDPRSTNAVDVAIRFGEGNATDQELADAAAAAAAAYAAAYASYAAADAAAAYAADADAAYARQESLLQSAEICRKYLPIEIWGL